MEKEIKVRYFNNEVSGTWLGRQYTSTIVKTEVSLAELTTIIVNKF